MRQDALPVLAAVAISAALLTACREPGGQKPPGAPPTATVRGAGLFKERCAPCHPDGGNTINPKKTLHAGVLADHGIRDARGIVKVMRTPGPGMPPFDPSVIPDADATLIAEYVLATFR